jgi:hypothetical protein
MCRKEIEVGLFSSAIQALVAAEGDDQLNCCEKCFPMESDGVRVGYRYMERVTGLSRQGACRKASLRVGEPDHRTCLGRLQPNSRYRQKFLMK